MSVLSATVVYCGQTVGWIKMPLGMAVGLGPGHSVLDGDPDPPKRGTEAPTFRPTSIVTKRSPISATAELLLKQKLITNTGWIPYTGRIYTNAKYMLR